jgi:hypothetical protein
MTTDGGSAARPGDARQEATPPAGGPNAAAESQRDSGTLPGDGSKADLPEQFGRYSVKRKLGGGGMGTVYLVENTDLRREEALKVPHFDPEDGEEVRQRFLREAQAAARLDHPNLCSVYDVGVQAGVCYLTMRYLQGRPLADYIGKPQSPRRAVEIVAKLAQALEHAHGKGVIHRDLKPSNVMMCPGLGPVIMDFGLAKQTRHQDQRLTQTGTALGTPAYMPPEQVKGELGRIGPASDVYSLGVILFELLTGELPFAGSLAEVYGKILFAEAPPPSALRRGLSPALDAVCRKALAKAPEQRYPTMKAFAAALIDYLRAAPAEQGAGKPTPRSAAAPDIFQAPTVAPAPVLELVPVVPGEGDDRAATVSFACTACGKQHTRSAQEVGTLVFCSCGHGNRVPWKGTVPTPRPPEKPPPRVVPVDKNQGRGSKPRVPWVVPIDDAAERVRGPRRQVGAGRPMLWQAVLSVLLGVGAWGSLVAFALLDPDLSFAAGMIILLVTAVPSLAGVGLGAWVLFGRGRPRVVAIIGLVLSALQTCIVIGLGALAGMAEVFK